MRDVTGARRTWPDVHARVWLTTLTVVYIDFLFYNRFKDLQLF